MRIPSLQLSSGLLALQGVLISSTRAIPDEHGVVAEPDRAPLHPHSTCADVLRWTPSRQEPAIVLQVVSKSFVYVQENFLILMEERSCFTRENLYLMCLDDDARATMADEGIPCVPIHRVKSLRQLWNLRVHTLGCLLAGGWNVFLSDSDALWLSDPIVDMALAGVNEIDIVTQRGGYPYKQNDEWGVTMCMGFALFRSRDREGMALYQNAMRENIAKTGDDQVALNMAAYNLGVVWDQSSDMNFYNSTGIGKGIVTSLPGNFTVALLPHSKYIRHCDETPISNDTVVAHCRSRKKDGDKLRWMKSAHLWNVDDTSVKGTKESRGKEARGDTGGNEEHKTRNNGDPGKMAESSRGSAKISETAA